MEEFNLLFKLNIAAVSTVSCKKIRVSQTIMENRMDGFVNFWTGWFDFSKTVSDQCFGFFAHS
jgi:hypothetical protein